MKKIILSILAGVVMIPLASHQSFSGSFEIGVYGGVGESFDSDVRYRNVDASFTHSDVSWDGDSFGPAPYWGARLTWWPSSMPSWGFMLDYTHAKMKAEFDSGTSGAGNVGANYNRLEFTDGLNLVTLNAVYKIDRWDTFKPYIGAGIGLAIPHVEVERTGVASTMEYQVTGVALQALLGARYELSENWGLFGEYKFSYAQIDADLAGGGSLETNGLTNHFLFGVSYKFGGYEDRKPWK